MKKMSLELKGIAQYMDIKESVQTDRRGVGRCNLFFTIRNILRWFGISKMICRIIQNEFESVS